MNELVFGAVLIISATLFGISFSQKLINRRKNLQMLIEVIRKMQTYIGFSSMEISAVVAECFKNIKGFESFTQYVSEDTAFTTWWEKCVRSIDSSTGLDREDKDLLIRFSEGIGVSDAEGQLSHCELYCELFAERLRLAKEVENTKSRLYKVLGFSVGCAVTLIVV